MVDQICVVDHERPGTRSIAGRWFCEEHYAKATRNRAAVWRAAGLAVLGLVVFVAALVGLDTVVQPDLTGTGLLLVGVILAVVPAVLWLVFFYQQDRLEPEPVGHVARMFVLGLALAGAVGIPLTDQFFRVQDWLYRDTLTTFLGSIFVIGAVEAFIIYAVVRYFIFTSPEFDERTDGVVYATAAGLGYATALNLQFILSNGGAALGAGEIFVAEVALAQAAFGGLLGYFLGRARLEQEPTWWLPAGLVLTAVLNGLFNVLRNQVDPGTISVAGQGSGLPSFTGLLLAGGLAVIITAVVSFLINRDINRSLSGNQPAVTSDPTLGDKLANYVVVGTFAALMLVGALTWNNAVNGTKPLNWNGFTGVYPSYFSEPTSSEDTFRVVDTLNTGSEFIVTTRAVEGSQTVEGIATQLTGERSTDYSLYKEVERGLTQVNGKDALMQRFAYVDAGALTGTVPEVKEGIDYIFVEGGRAVVVTLLTTSDELPSMEPLFARFLNSLSF
jgi:RsiW-degrading membrane proteinase PrsW (M82 family)